MTTKTYKPSKIGIIIHKQYCKFLCYIFGRLFAAIEYPIATATKMRELAKDGTIIYVARANTGIMSLYFNHTLSTLDLPLAQFIGGTSLSFWRLLLIFWRRWLPRFRFWSPFKVPPPEILMRDKVIQGNPALLFIRPWTQRRAKKRHNYLQALISAQRKSNRPIYVLPHVFVHPSQSGAVYGPIGSRIFGAGRRNGRLHELVMLLFNPGRINVRVSDPIDLKAMLTASPDADDMHLTRRLAHEINRSFDEEERVVVGPNLSTIEKTKRHVLRYPLVREAINKQSAARNVDNLDLELRAERLFYEIAARYNTHLIRWFAFIMRFIFNRIYDGIIVDEAGLAHVLEAARKGPLVFCPSHKSHIDYLVLSSLLWQRSITPPHIASGVNMFFFPMGFIFRRAGAFALRRTFRNDDLYRAVFSSYIIELVRTGTSIEFFPEGTRSRSGKLAPPKFGMLGMLVNAWRSGARKDLQFVPVSIDYERIIEAGSYERELMGADKKSEDISALLRSTKVLRSRYGRVHVQFGDPISLAELANKHGLLQSDDPTYDDKWRRETERLGYHILHDVAQICMVTPISVAATALLGHRGRGLPQSLLLELGESIIEYLDSSAARLSEVIRLPYSRKSALLHAMQELISENSVRVDRAGYSDSEPIYRVNEEARIRLNFYKNAVMNYFAPAALMARAILHYNSTSVSQTKIYNDSKFLSHLFKREFLYRVDTSYTTHFDDTLATLAIRSVLDVLDEGTIIVKNINTINNLAGMLDSFVEAYWVVIQTISDLYKFPLWDKELATRARERARRYYLEGIIRSPEAASNTLIDSALKWALDVNIISVKSEGRRRHLKLTKEYESEKLNKLADEIGSYLHY
ncbi:MAG: 1-acyl-sn-glycerol-3-phosphate acyltransferase [Deltaproteobacteria bacterium]|nr:1-acyl-sn-glycerol-3-phosphate acyltransferase [Deltaproteobacteria bacterium]